eukprot:GHVQ01035448.1.p1 GENE.GHVQ01035448.1~~GHVQ01035448.1.p1  ORF type:complete len:207 (+),score=24.52 GHVQ01035448.1:224-844(+)
MACCGKPKSTDMFSDLAGACFTGQLERIMCRLKDGDPVNAKDKDGYGPIHRAAQGGHIAALAVLIQHDANPRLPSSTGLTPLHVAAFHKRLGVVNELLNTKAKEDVNTQDRQHGMTPLHMAINRGASDVATVLLRSGTDALIKDNYGYCAMPSAEFWNAREAMGYVSKHTKRKVTHAQLVKLKCPQPHTEYFDDTAKRSTAVAAAS